MEFPKEYIPTIFDQWNEYGTLDRTVSINDEDIPIAIELQDTAGQSEFDRLRSIFVMQSDIVFLCFHVLNINSFENIELKWLPEARHYVPDAIPILVGLQNDLKLPEYDYRDLVFGYIHQLRFYRKLNIINEVIEIVLSYTTIEFTIEVSAERKRYLQWKREPPTKKDIHEMVERIKTEYIEVSARSGNGINTFFQIAIEAYFKQKQPPSADPGGCGCIML